MATVIRGRFADRPKLVRPDVGEAVASALREAFRGLRELPGALELFDTLLDVVDRRSAARQRWRFVMIDPDRYQEVVRYLRTWSKRPAVALDLWATLFCHLTEDGQVVISRDELAREVGLPAREVSRIVAALARVGAMRTERSGASVRYFVSPVVGTHLPEKKREDAQRLWKLPAVGRSALPTERRSRAASVVAVVL